MTTKEQILATVKKAMFLDPADYDEAIIGVAYRCGMDPVVAYDRTTVIDILARDMSREDAEEFFEFNTLGSWWGDVTPVFIDTRPAE
jgi:hypothetical protein